MFKINSPHKVNFLESFLIFIIIKEMINYAKNIGQPNAINRVNHQQKTTNKIP